MKQRIVIGIILASCALAVFAQWKRKNADARRMGCSNNLKYVALSLHNYHDMRGSFPPAVTFGPDGTPWHSWRTLVSQPEGYRFDEPWDSPHNLDIAETSPMAELFRCPSDSGERNETSYFMVVGEGFLSDGPNTVTLSMITDGMSYTVAVLEVEKPDILWTEPTDVTFEELLDLREKPSHSKGSNAMLADGSIRSFDLDSLSPDELRAMLTIAGGESTALH